MKGPMNYRDLLNTVQTLMNEGSLSEAYALLNTIGCNNVCHISPNDYERLVELRRELTRRMAKALVSGIKK